MRPALREARQRLRSSLDALADHAGVTVEIYRPIVNRFLTGLLELSPTALVASERRAA